MQQNLTRPVVPACVDRLKYKQEYESKCGRFLIYPDVNSIEDETDAHDAPAIYYVFDNHDNQWYEVTTVGLICGEAYEFCNFLYIQEDHWDLDNLLFRKIGESGEAESEIFKSAATKEHRQFRAMIWNAIAGIAEEFDESLALEAEADLEEEGYPAKPYLSNGDPGYPGESDSYSVTCPACDTTQDQEPEDNSLERCECCKKWLHIRIPEDVGYNED